MDYKKKYENALEWARHVINGECGFIRKDVEEVFPELKESENERIRKGMLQGFKDYGEPEYVWWEGVKVKECIAWLEGQGKSNPYSGVSFEYDGHTWGMCARDYGVDILCDKHIIGHLEKQGEQKPNWCEGCNNAKGCVVCVDGSEWAHIEEHNPAWSEEDEEQVSIITDIVKAHCGKLIDCRANLKWLESLKERLQ